MPIKTKSNTIYKYNKPNIYIRYIAWLEVDVFDHIHNTPNKNIQIDSELYVPTHIIEY